MPPLEQVGAPAHTRQRDLDELPAMVGLIGGPVPESQRTGPFAGFGLVEEGHYAELSSALASGGADLASQSILDHRWESTCRTVAGLLGRVAFAGSGTKCLRGSTW